MCLKWQLEQHVSLDQCESCQTSQMFDTVLLGTVINRQKYVSVHVKHVNVEHHLLLYVSS